MSTIAAVSGIDRSAPVTGRAPYANVGAPTDSLTGLARAMGLSKDELTDRLKTGKSITQIAQAQGLRDERLLAALQAGGPSELRRQAAAAKVTTVAAAVKASGAWQYPRKPGDLGDLLGTTKPPGSAKTAGAAGALDTAGKLELLATALGTDTPALLAQLRAGGGLTGLRAPRAHVDVTV